MGLDLDNLTAGYGKSQIITGISLKVDRGCICAVMGRNGSGKTTLLRCINRFLEPAAGRIRIMGEDIRQLSQTRVARLVSLVPQTSRATFPFSCLDMVLMAGASRLQAWEAPSAADREKAMAALAETGIGHAAPRPFNRLSGGEQQLVLIARGLYQDTPVILLDEPTAHLDFANQHRIMGRLHDLVKQKNLTALVTLHDPNLTLLYSDLTLMIRNGRREAFGPTADTLTDILLTRVLGENICRGRTLSGMPVVTPRHAPGIHPDKLHKEAQ